MKNKLNKLTSIAVSAAGVMLFMNTQAANLTWTGGNNPDFNWNVNNNWGGTAPVANDLLFFAGAVGLQNTNNFNGNTPFGGITFNSGVGSFTLIGNTLTLANGGGITNNSANSQTNRITLNATNSFINNYVTTPGGGALVLAQNALNWANAAVTNSSLIIKNASIQSPVQFGIGGNNNSISNVLLIQNSLIDGVGNSSSRLNSGNGISDLIVLDNSVITNFAGMIIGNGGTSFNTTLVISNGSKFYISGADIFEVNRNTGAQGNKVVVTGAGSAWINRGTHAFNLGGSSGNCTNAMVEVNNGALWDLGGSTFRLNYTGPANSISASNGTIQNVYSMIIGNNSYSNSMTLINGSKFTFSASSGDFRELGRGNNAFNNTLTLSGPNTVWDDGGATFTVGGTQSATGNFSNIMTVATGAVFTNGNLTVGGQGTLQSLVISNASVYANSLIVNGNSSVVYCNGGSGDTLWVGSLGNNAGGLLTNSAATTLNLVLGWGNGGQTANPVPIISGLVNITKTGSGTQNLNNANTFTGNILVNGGTLGSGAAQAAADGSASAFGNLVAPGKTIVITNGGTLNLGSTMTLLNGLTANTLPPITVYAGSTLNSSRFNPIGQLTLNGGTLLQNSSDASPLNGYQFYTNVTVGGSAASTISVGANGLADDLYDAANGGTTFNVANTASGGSDLTVSAPLADYSNGGSAIPGALTKSGVGIMALSGTNTYTGLTTIANGKLILYTYSLQSGPVTVNDGKTLDITVSGANQITNSTLTIGNSTGAVIEFVGLNSTTVAPVVAPNLNLNGPATINLVSPSVAAGNQYPLITYTTTGGAGGFVLGAKPRGSTMSLATNNNGDGTFTVVLNVTTLGAATTDVWSGNQNSNWDINTSVNWTISASPNTYFDGDFVQFTDAASVTNVTLNTTVTPGSTTVNSTKNYSFISSGGGHITGSGGLSKSGSGTLTLAGVVNTYIGTNSITGGTITIDADSNLGVTTNNVVLNGGTLSAINTLTLSANRSLLLGPVSGAGTGTLNVSNNQTLTFAGLVANNGAGVGSLTKTGPGTLSLTGANTYSGSTTVSAGKLIVTTAQQSGGAFTVSDAAALTIIANGGAKLPMSSLTLGTSGATTLTLQGISGTNAPITATNLIANGTVTVNVSGGATKLGEIPLIKYSSLTGSLANFTLSPTLPPNVTAVLTNDVTGKFIGLVITSINGLTWKGANGGTWDIASSTNWLFGTTNSVFSDGSAVLFNDSGANSVTISQLVSPSSTVVSNSGVIYTFTPANGSAGIGGPGGLTKLGSSTLSFASVTNSYAGVTVIGNGSINLAAHPANAAGSALLEFSTNSVTITNNAFLVLAGIGGSGTVWPQTMANNITLDGGNIFATDGGQHLTGSLTIGANGTAFGDQQINKYLFLDGPVSGSGSISVPLPGGINDGIHTPGGSGYGGPSFTYSANPYSGTITVYNGYLGIQDINGTCLANATVNLLGFNANAGAAFIYTSNQSFSITLGGLSGSNAGVNLDLDPSGGVDLILGNNNSGTVVYQGKVSGHASTAFGNVTKVGAGTQWLAGTNAYSGLTTISSGTLGISTLHAGNGDFTVADGAALAVTNRAGSSSAAIANLTLGSSGATTVEFQNVADPLTSMINCSGALTVNGNSTIKITGTAGLAAGNTYPLIANAGISGAGGFALSVPAGVTANLVTNGNTIALNVTAIAPPVNTSPTNITTVVSGGNLTLTWPTDHTGWRLQVQTNSLSVGLGTNWFTVANSTTTNSMTVPINAANGSVFYRMVYP